MRRPACILFLSWVFAVSIAGSALQAGENDWPCGSARSESFAPEVVWGGPLPAPLGTDWRAEPRVLAVVEHAANPENRPAMGERRIAEFAQSLEGDRAGPLMQVYAGLLDEFSTLRRFLTDGITDYVLRARIIDAEVRANRAAIAALQGDTSAAAKTARDGIRPALDVNERLLDDVEEEAEFFCRRYDYLTRKLGKLTEAIRVAIRGSV